MDRWWRRYLAVGALVVAAYLLVPAGVVRDVVYVLVGCSSAVAITVGVRRHRPAAASAWWLVGAGQLLSTSGDALYNWYADVAHTSPYPSAADALYLLAYPLITAGLVRLVRVRRRGLDVAGLVDSTIVTAGLGLVSWVLLAGPVTREAGQSLLERSVGVAYPAADIVLLALLVRLVTLPGARSAPFRLLVAAAGLLLAADTAYALLNALASYDGGAVDLLWLGSYVLWGTAALHPSMRTLSEPGGEPAAPFTRRRLAALAVAVLLAPSTLAVELLVGHRLDAWAVVLASVVLFALVVVRMNAAVAEVTASARQRERLQGVLAHQATHDPLTALANRARVLDLVQAALHRAQRSGSPVGLLLVDLDHFKAVNDAHGHRAGDDVLREVASRMRALVRAGDTVGRLGGDEFVVLVEPLGSEADLVDLAERLVAELAAPVLTGGREVGVGASIGVAVSRDGGTDATTLLHDADVAAHRAKAAGRGCVEVFDDALRRELHERAVLEAAIRAGLARGEFLLHYQPVVHVPSGTVEGYEALLRWERPGHGLVPPDAFIPVAERSALVCDLGRWVLLEAASQLVRWEAEHPGDEGISVAVNISGRHLAEARVLPDVADALVATGVRPDRIILEITETVLVDEPRATAHLLGLRDLGVGISIDDFGTGYTSIGQLQHLHADTLKIDRSLVASTAPGATELVRLVVHAAHAFGLSVVAEGVEQEAQLQALAEAGCDSAQGYLFSRPRPAGAFSRPREGAAGRPGTSARTGS